MQGNSHHDRLTVGGGWVHGDQFALLIDEMQGGLGGRRWRHRHGSPGHGADHVVPLLAPPSLTVPVTDGRMGLGTWQSICLLDPNADNDTRTVRLSFLAG